MVTRWSSISLRERECGLCRGMRQQRSCAKILSQMRRFLVGSTIPNVSRITLGIGRRRGGLLATFDRRRLLCSLTLPRALRARACFVMPHGGGRHRRGSFRRWFCDRSVALGSVRRLRAGRLAGPVSFGGGAFPVSSFEQRLRHVQRLGGSVRESWSSVFGGIVGARRGLLGVVFVPAVRHNPWLRATQRRAVVLARAVVLS